MKSFKFRGLGFRLSVLCAICTLSAVVPISFYYAHCIGEIKSASRQSYGTRMLASLSVLAHSAFVSSTGGGGDAAVLKKNIDILVKTSPKVADAALKKNLRMGTILAKPALEAFAQNPIGDIVPDIASYTAIHSGLFVDSRIDIHVFTDVSASLLPKLYASIFDFSTLIKKYSANADRAQINELSSAAAVISEYARESASELRRACTMCAPDKSVAIVSDITKLNSALGEFNMSVAKLWHGKGADISQIRANLAVLEQSVNEIWNVSNSTLSALVSAREAEVVGDLKSKTVWIAVSLAIVLLSALISARAITSAARRTRIFARYAASDAAKAREYFENAPSQTGLFSETEADIAKLLEKYSDIADSAEFILDSSAQLNADAQSIVETQRPRINGISNGLLRLEAKINLRDKSDAALAASAQMLRDRLNSTEQLARVQNKSVAEVSSEIRTALSAANDVISKIDTLRGIAAKMGVIAETFTGVADQANILSLNLAIETAKAGIKGSGLGTLAEQVKLLSKRTVVSVIDIESLRDSIIETLDSSAVDTEKFISVLESDSKILDEIDGALAEIISSLSKISASTNAVSVSLRERGTSDISITDAQENLSKIDESFSEFSAFSKNAVSVVNNAREKLGRGEA